MKVLTTFAGQNWLITPAALAVGQPPPASIQDQLWLLILSGVVVADFQGNSGTQWRPDTVSFSPDLAGPDNQGPSGPLPWAINHWGIPQPAPPADSYSIGFSVVEWAPFASLSSLFDQDQAVNAGFAVDGWRPTPFLSGTDIVSQQPVANLFSGINVDVAVRDSDAWIFRIGYHISLLGKIVFPVKPGPQTTVVPPVVGKGLEAAVIAVANAGLVARTNPQLPPPNWVVAQVTPEEGTEVPLGSGVLLRMIAHLP
jgi:hypothetical protein